MELANAQVTLARFLFDQREALTNFFMVRSPEDRCLRAGFHDLYESITGNSDMSQITDIMCAAFKDGALQFLRGVAVEVYLLDVLGQCVKKAEEVRTGTLAAIKAKLVKTMTEGNSPVVFGPVTLASGINSPLGHILHAIVSTAGMHTTVEERRRGLVTFAKLKIPWTQQVHHEMCPNEKKTIPSAIAVVRLSEYKKSLLSESTELTLVDFFLVLTGKEPCVTNMDGRARLDIISVVKDSYHELLKDFSQKNCWRTFREVWVCTRCMAICVSCSEKAS